MCSYVVVLLDRRKWRAVWLPFLTSRLALIPYLTVFWILFLAARAFNFIVLIGP